jgi:hypothetical protein
VNLATVHFINLAGQGTAEAPGNQPDFHRELSEYRMFGEP